MFMGDMKKEISSNNRSTQDNTIQEFRKNKLDGVTRYPKYWITELELLRGNLQKMRIIINDV